VQRAVDDAERVERRIRGRGAASGGLGARSLGAVEEGDPAQDAVLVRLQVDHADAGPPAGRDRLGGQPQVPGQLAYGKRCVGAPRARQGGLRA
jgi:hypothetical protein